LRRTVEEYLDAAALVTLPGPLMALVAPHAGYRYSGPTAAHAYAQLRPRPAFRRVVLLGPLHRLIRGSPLGAVMVPTEDAYQTPLGPVAVDHDFIAALGQKIQLPVAFRPTPVRRDEEHSLEIQLPFLQVALGNAAHGPAAHGPAAHGPFTLAPLMLGMSVDEPGAPAGLDALAGALAETMDDETLLVASTDLSHLDDYADAVRIDRALAELVAAFDVDGLVEALRAKRVHACGGAGLVTVLRACQLRGARGARVLAYAASGDVTGDKRPGVYTVGYLAAAVHS
jgi:hypothetical protein